MRVLLGLLAWLVVITSCHSYIDTNIDLLGGREGVSYVCSYAPSKDRSKAYVYDAAGWYRNTIRRSCEELIYKVKMINKGKKTTLSFSGPDNDFLPNEFQIEASKITEKKPGILSVRHKSIIKTDKGKLKVNFYYLRNGPLGGVLEIETQGPGTPYTRRHLFTMLDHPSNPYGFIGPPRTRDYLYENVPVQYWNFLDKMQRPGQYEEFYQEKMREYREEYREKSDELEAQYYKEKQEKGEPIGANERKEMYAMISKTLKSYFLEAEKGYSNKTVD